MGPTASHWPGPGSLVDVFRWPRSGLSLSFWLLPPFLHSCTLGHGNRGAEPKTRLSHRSAPSRTRSLLKQHQRLVSASACGEAPRGSTCQHPVPHLVVVGGGAAGVFGALRAKELCGEGLEVTVLEKSQPLSKVRISGGGRCNVTTGLSSDPLFLAAQYPRGHRELRGAFFRTHGPGDTMAWFRERGVELKTESDGRVFPVSDSSQTIIDCLLQEARALGVRIRTGWPVGSILLSNTHSRGDAAHLSHLGSCDATIDQDQGNQRGMATRHTGDSSCRRRETIGLAHPEECSWDARPERDTAAAASDGDSEEDNQGFIITSSKKSSHGVGSGTAPLTATFVLLATGSSPKGYELAQALGHSVVPPCPSLFTFNVDDPALQALAGVSVEEVTASLEVPVPEALSAAPINALASSSPEQTGGANVAMSGNSSGRRKKPGRCIFRQKGPLLFTHWGLSGPLVLRLSAWAARELYSSCYEGTLTVDFSGGSSEAQVLNELRECRARHRHARVVSFSPDFVSMPRRVWQYLVTQEPLAVPEALLWGDASNRVLAAIAQKVTRAMFAVAGKGKFKEEFVTAGGVPLSEVLLQTMESRVAPGLFFAGEILNVDGVTGGFNFQNAWSSSFVAGSAVHDQVMAMKKMHREQNA